MVSPADPVVVVMAGVGSSPVRGPAEREATGGAASRLAQSFDALLQRHGGARLGAEDGRLLAGFPTAAAGLTFALAVQQESADVAPRPRMAIDVGDAPPGAGGVSDWGRCAALLDVAHPGQTLVSRAARDQVASQLPGTLLIDLGSARLRDLSRPERVYQQAHERMPSEFPPLRSLDTIPNNLPIDRTSFIGRRAELISVATLVAARRLVTLTGAGGSGKTRLALRAAADLAPRYAEGVWWVDLARLADGALVVNAVANALGLKEVPGEDLLATLERWLRGRTTLLVLDNCEHLLPACLELVQTLLERCPSSSLLATSREPLGVEGEVAWRVPSLILPSDTEAAEALIQSEAVRLFATRAAGVRPGFRLDRENVGTIAAICQRLDGIPLAIELAAARVRMISVEQILAGLKDRFHLLTGGTRSALPRHQTLRASVEWSHRLLAEQERVMLRRLAVFAGSFTLDAAGTVCAGDGIARDEVLDLLAGLVDRSLVQVTEAADPARYRLLETIRQYANDRLMESGEADSVRARHLGYYVALAERAEPEMERAGLLPWLAILDAEHDDLRAALDWGTQAEASEQLLRLTSALWQFWMLRGYLSEGRRRFEVALAAAAPPRLRASALVGAGQLMINQGDLEATARFASEALEIARRLDDRRLEGRALDTLGYAAAFRDPATALPLFHDSATASRAAGDGAFLADALNGVGISRFLTGDYLGATVALEEAVACSRKQGNASTLTLGLGVLGYALVLQGRLARARTCVRESLATARRLRDRTFTAQSLYTVGFIEAERAQHGAAEAALVESVALAREASPLMLSFALLTHGLARYIAADLAGARPLLAEALGLGRELRTPWVLSSSLALLANIARMEGDLPQARALSDEALDVARSNNLRSDLPLDAAARVARAGGELPLAESLHHQALAAARAAQSVLLVPMQLEALAGHAVLAENFPEAARLFGAAQAAREAHGLVLHEVDRPGYETDVQRIRDVLGVAELGAAWEEGRAMSLDQASDYTARGRGERKRPSFGWDSLTPTELEVVRNVARGLTNPDIARRLFVSRSTVKAHLAHVFAKLDVSTRAELAALATRRGLATPDPAK